MGRGGVWRVLEVSHHLRNYPQVKVGDWKICVQEIIRDGCAVQTSQQRVKKKMGEDTEERVAVVWRALSPVPSFYYENYQTWREVESIAH